MLLELIDSGEKNVDFLLKSKFLGGVKFFKIRGDLFKYSNQRSPTHRMLSWFEERSGAHAIPYRTTHAKMVVVDVPVG
jgi:hypothetical protein